MTSYPVGTFVGVPNRSGTRWGRIYKITKKETNNEYSIQFSHGHQATTSNTLTLSKWCLTDPAEILEYSRNISNPSTTLWKIEFNSLEWNSLGPFIEVIKQNLDILTPDSENSYWDPVNPHYNELNTLPIILAQTKDLTIVDPPYPSPYPDHKTFYKTMFEWAKHEQDTRDSITWNTWLTENHLDRQQITQISEKASITEYDHTQRKSYVIARTIYEGRNHNNCIFWETTNSCLCCPCNPQNTKYHSNPNNQS